MLLYAVRINVDEDHDRVLSELRLELQNLWNCKSSELVLNWQSLWVVELELELELKRTELKIGKNGNDPNPDCSTRQ